MFISEVYYAMWINAVMGCIKCDHQRKGLIWHVILFYQSPLGTFFKYFGSTSAWISKHDCFLVCFLCLFFIWPSTLKFSLKNVIKENLNDDFLRILLSWRQTLGLLRRLINWTHEGRRFHVWVWFLTNCFSGRWDMFSSTNNFLESNFVSWGGVAGRSNHRGRAT